MAYVISKNRLWQKVAYVPNQAQRKIHECTSRYLVTAAGRRTGKSTAGGHELLPEVYRAYLRKDLLEEQGLRDEYWIVGPQYTDSEKEFRSFYNACKKLQMPFDRPGTYYDARGGDMQVSLWGGKFLLKAQSAKYPEHLVGEGLNGVIMAEAAKMKERIWTQFIMPTLMDFRGWGKFNSTPEGKNWFYDLYMKGIAQDIGWSSLRFPSWANTAVFPKGQKDPEILQMKQDMSPEMFAQEVEAKFGEYVGRVFKDWDEDWHVRRKAYDPSLPVFLATDWGWTNPNVALFIQVDHWKRVHVISEYYQSHRSADEMADELEQGVQDSRHPALCRAASLLFPDPEDPKSAYTLSERLRLRTMGGTGGELKTRLELIRKWLKDENPHLGHDHVDRVPMLTVDPQCTNTIHEMDAYRYAERKDEATEAPENPMKKWDHTPEALGRFFVGHFGAEAVGARPKQRKARYARHRRPAVA